MKKALLVILGLGCIAGVVFYLFSRIGKHNDDRGSSYMDHDTSVSPKKNETEADISTIKNAVEEEKEEASSNIKERHQEAASEMKKSVDAIFNEKKDNRSTNNTEKINSLMDDIDNL